MQSYFLGRPYSRDKLLLASSRPCVGLLSDMSLRIFVKFDIEDFFIRICRENPNFVKFGLKKCVARYMYT